MPITHTYIPSPPSKLNCDHFMLWDKMGQGNVKLWDCIWNVQNMGYRYILYGFWVLDAATRQQQALQSLQSGQVFLWRQFNATFWQSQQLYYNYLLLQLSIFAMTSPALRIAQLDQPTVWCVMNSLAQTIKCIDLGNGAASGNPPSFYTQSLSAALTMDHSSSPPQPIGLLQAIASYHQLAYPNLDPQRNIQVLNGAHVCMYACFAAFINPGDQIIVFDPSYSYYRKQSQLHQGKVVGVPLTPKHYQSTQQLKMRLEEQIEFQTQDQWAFDSAKLQQSFNEKTKIIIINSPHNPTGKIFSNHDLDAIATLLRKHPQTLIVQDNIYQSYVFDKFDYSTITKLSQREEFKHRCLSIYSAGKLFKATGIRMGWILGPQQLIQQVRYANHCMYGQGCAFLQKCVELSLNYLVQSNNSFSIQEANRLQNNRNTLLTELASCQLDLGVWVPQSGYFVMMDISRFEPKPKYKMDEEGRLLSHDYACALHFAHEYGVITIPCCSFFEEDGQSADKYLRLAFCKDHSSLLGVGKRLMRQAQTN